MYIYISIFTYMYIYRNIYHIKVYVRIHRFTEVVFISETFPPVSLTVPSFLTLLPTALFT